MKAQILEQRIQKIANGLFLMALVTLAATVWAQSFLYKVLS